jgi:hypothetical protein
MTRLDSPGWDMARLFSLQQLGSSSNLPGLSGPAEAAAAAAATAADASTGGPEVAAGAVVELPDLDGDHVAAALAAAATAAAADDDEDEGVLLHGHSSTDSPFVTAVPAGQAEIHQAAAL